MLIVNICYSDGLLMRIVVFSAGLLNSSCIAVVNCRVEGADLTEASEFMVGRLAQSQRP